MVLALSMVAGMLPPTTFTAQATDGGVGDTSTGTPALASQTAMASTSAGADVPEAISSDDGIATIAESDFSGGSGKQWDPYIIGKDGDLDYIASQVNGGVTNYEDVYFKIADYATTLKVETPIGRFNGGTRVAFDGTFDGNFKTIELESTFSKNGVNDMGVFAYNTGTIKNLNVKNVTTGAATFTQIELECETTEDFYIGAVAAYNAGDIINCTNSITVSATLKGTHYTTDVKNDAGTRIGYNYYYASVTTYVGGIVGYNESTGRVINCVNNATVVSSAEGTYTVATSPSTDDGSSTATAHAGGIVGYNNKGTVVNSINYGQVTATGTNTTSAATGSAAGKAYAGGIVGTNVSAGVVANSYSSAGAGKVSAVASGNTGGTASDYQYENKAGGVVGDGSSTKCYYLTGEATATGSNSTINYSGSPFTSDGWLDPRDGRLVDKLSTWVSDSSNDTVYTEVIKLYDDGDTTGATGVAYTVPLLYQWENVLNPSHSYRVSTFVVNGTTQSTTTYGTVVATPAYLQSGTVDVLYTPKVDTNGNAQYITRGATVKRIAGMNNISHNDTPDNAFDFAMPTVAGSVIAVVEVDPVVSTGCTDHLKWPTVTTETALKAAALTGGDFVVADLSIFTNETVDVYGIMHLCLNGQAVSANGSFPVFTVHAGGSLTICGGGINKDGKITHTSSKQSTGVVVNAYGIFNLDSGYISGNNNGVVINENGTFNLRGADAVIGDNSGSGVFMMGGDFTMSAGEIGTLTSGALNNVPLGNPHSGVRMKAGSAGTFTMTGGTIHNNTTTESGGGVYVGADNTFHMEGGTITGNTSGSFGSGVYVGGTMTMAKAPTVTDNGKDGIYLDSGCEIGLTSDLTGAVGSIFVSKAANSDGKIVVDAATFDINVAAEATHFACGADDKIFYRASEDALFLAKVVPEAKDFLVAGESITEGKHELTTIYSGNYQDPEVTLRDNGNVMDKVFKVNNVVYDGIPKDAGTYEIYVTLANNDHYYDNEVHVGTYVIKPFTLVTDEYTLTATPDNFIYDGDPHYPVVTVTIKVSPFKDVIMDANQYQTVYTDNVEIGDGLATVTGYAGIPGSGKGNFIFSDSVTFNIKNQETDVVINNLNDLVGMDHIYGDELRVTVTPQMPTNSGFVGVGGSTAYKVTMYVVDEFNVETQLGAHNNTPDPDYAVGSLTNSDTYTMTYDTALKHLSIGDNKIRVRFTVANNGTDNMGSNYTDFNLHMIPKPLTGVEVTENQFRAYNGSSDYTANLTLKPIEIQTTVHGTDEVSAVAYGYVNSPNADKYNLNVTSTELFGNEAEYYSLANHEVITSNQVEITKKDLDSVSKILYVDVMEGVGTYTTPNLIYTNELLELVEIPGNLVYTDSTYTSYDEIVAKLKTMSVKETLEVLYSFTPDNPNNFTNANNITGRIVFTVVEIGFSGVEEAIVIPNYPVYGDLNNFFYDPSKFIANVGTSTTTGAYFLTVTDSLGTTMTDLSLLKVGTYKYSVTFTSYDSSYVNVAVTSGSFNVNKRFVDIEWDSLVYAYDSSEKVPSASITNIVWVDDVSIAVTGGQTNVGNYTAQLSLAGGDRNNYDILSKTVTFSIESSQAKGVVSMNANDIDGSGTLTAGDVLTADVSAIAPTGGSVFYHWYRNDVLMSSATWPTYTLAAGDIAGTVIHCQVTLSGNTTGEIASTGVVVGSTFFSGSVTISHVAGVLTATVANTNTESYTIYWTGLNSSSSGKTYNMNNADYGNTVTATVVANETSGFCGSISTTISVAPIKPYAPEITVTPGDTSAHIAWETVFHGGSPLISYTLTVTNSTGTPVTGSPYVIGTAATTFNVSGLENGEAYSFQLSATNSVGTSNSIVITATPTSPDDDTDTETDGNITTTTTTNVYVGADGSTVTETVTTETDSANGTVKITTVTQTEGTDGSLTRETVSEKTDKDGNVIESVTKYTVSSDEMTLSAETLVNGSTSQGTLTAETRLSDTISLPVSLVQTIASKSNSTVTLMTPNADVVFNNAALETIFTKGNPSTTGTMEIVAELTSPSLMPVSVRDRLSNAFIVDLTVRLGGVVVSDFGVGTATITLPYTRNDSSKTTSVYYVADSGSMTRMNDAVYQNSSRSITFTTSHFSYYAVLEESANFSDVYSTDFYYDAVMWAVENDITSGTTATTFSPNDICTRSQAMALLWKAMGKNIVNINIPFTDVSSNDYFYEAVRWAYARGVTDGTSPTTFSPYALCSRSQIVTFLWIANGSPIVGGNLYFSDVPAGSWYADAVRWAVSEGITSGTGSTTFSPDSVCTRGEIVTFLYNNLGK